MYSIGFTRVFLMPWKVTVLPSTFSRSLSFTNKAGELIFSPFTHTRPASITRSASLHKHIMFRKLV